MCWSLTISAILAILAFILSYRMIKKKESTYLWLALLYFGVMESLQALSYPVVGQCGLPSNQILTYLSYLHIAFQPIVINAFILYFIPKLVRQKIQKWVFGISFIASIALLVRLFPFSWAPVCNTASALCGTQMCTIQGNFHIGWTLPLNGIPIIGHAYFLAVFLMPLLYGAWRVVTLILIPSIGISFLTTTNIHEAPAIWCLISVILIIIALMPKMKKFLFHDKYYFWKWSKK